MVTKNHAKIGLSKLEQDTLSHPLSIRATSGIAGNTSKPSFLHDTKEEQHQFEVNETKRIHMLHQLRWYDCLSEVSTEYLEASHSLVVTKNHAKIGLSKLEQDTLSHPLSIRATSGIAGNTSKPSFLHDTKEEQHQFEVNETKRIHMLHQLRWYDCLSEVSTEYLEASHSLVVTKNHAKIGLSKLEQDTLSHLLSIRATSGIAGNTSKPSFLHDTKEEQHQFEVNETKRIHMLHQLLIACLKFQPSI